MYPGEINTVMTTLHIFEMQIDEACSDNADDYPKHLLTWFQAAILFAMIWGIGGILDTESRAKFDEYFRGVSAQMFT